MTGLRQDIQALRGIAVSLVILFHLGLGPFKAGYLGVDIFFVVSGFLITTLIASAYDEGRFSPAAFYYRRAKRLLPAAYATIGLTALLSAWFLNRQEMVDFVWQVVGAITFTSNVVLWQQTGYFDSASELKPLLHMWSLSIEEQYYMVLPALLLLLRRRLWLPVLAVLALASFGLCLAGNHFKPIAAFYLLPTRAWELLIGSVGALWALQRPTAGAATLRLLFYPAVLALFALAVVPFGGAHPGFGALAACTATLVVILRRHEAVEGWWPVRGLARIGDSSYSLYLVHWPLIALLRNAWTGPEDNLPLSYRWAMLGLIVLCGWALGRFVEVPVRRAAFRFSWPLLARTLALSVALMAIAPLILLGAGSKVNYSRLLGPNEGFGPQCNLGPPYAFNRDCSSGSAPRTVVWGDSYGMHLVPGLKEQLGADGIVQATWSGCGPFLGLAPQRQGVSALARAYTREWTERCMAFNRGVLDFIVGNPQIDTVVLSSVVFQYVDAREWVNVVASGAGAEERPATAENVRAALARTVRALHDAGKRVIFIAPPPVADFNIGSCYERQQNGNVTIGAPPGCLISARQYRGERAEVLRFLDLAEADGVPMIRFDAELCGEEQCRTRIDDTIVFRDRGHLSIAGSVLLAQRMHWRERIARDAR